jgi:hypothetical protein
MSEFIDKLFSDAADLALTPERMITTLIMALLAGILVFFVYKHFYRGVIYSHSFNVALVLSAVITSMIVLAISSNIVLSLGMVGALSIVRFRAAIKDPIDIVFLFWAISSGIVAGTGEYIFLIVANLIIAVTACVFFTIKTKSNSFLLIIDCESEIAGKLQENLTSSRLTLKSKSLVRERAEIIYEVKLKVHDDIKFVDKIKEQKGVISVVLVGFNGDYAE